MNLLEYENQMFLDAFHEDGLLISARGLALDRIFVNFLKLYCDAGNLVIVVNTNSHEEDFFLEHLQQDGVDPLPKSVTSEINISDRRHMYMQGGVLFVTSRILVVDLLTERIPVELITGFLVYKAHKVIDSGQEAFILRLFRQKNKKGFIKAFSDNPLSFTAGFCHVERVMKSLFLRKLFLWPRFQASVIGTMEKHPVDVVEMYVQLTDAMSACQTALLDLIDACVKELKRCNITLDSDEFSLENAITRSFDKIIRHHLDPIWHQLSGKSKQLVTDIKTLRLVLEHLTQYDCVNFHNLVNSIRSSERQFGSNSGWLFLDAADSLFVYAKDRVLRQETSKTKKQKSSSGDSSSEKPATALTFQPEPCPKWNALKEVLTEIEDECSAKRAAAGAGDVSDDHAGRVLVVAQDDRTCAQLKAFLCEGPDTLLQKLYDKTQVLKSKNPSDEMRVKTGLKRKLDDGNDGSNLTLTQMKRKKRGGDADTCAVDTKNVEASTSTTVTADDEDSDNSRVRLFDELSSDYFGRMRSSPLVILHPLHGSPDPFSLQRVLNEVQPRYVVMYDVGVHFVRMLEVFRATRPNTPLRVYFLMYEGSTEEQRYLTSLRKEKEAFEYLIRQKATMVIPEDREGRTDDNVDLARDATPANATVNTRQGGSGAAAAVVQHKVIVDMREFRSELPSLIHRRGIDIEPVTIQIGDYVLTPDICVERKSVSDLIGSLNNGRLYNQCLAMCRNYKRPVLLIEFDPNKSFSLQGKYQSRDDINSGDVISRLALLTLHFPRLRLFWCQSPHATAELFHAVKTNRAQPDVKQALATSGESDDDVTAAKYNHRPHTMLLKMPGVNSQNVHAVMNSVESIADLASRSQAELTEILGSDSNAKSLYRFLHKQYDASVTSSTVTSRPQPGTSRTATGRAESKAARKPVFYAKRKR